MPYEAVTVPGAKLEECLHVEAAGVGDAALDRAEADHPGSPLYAGQSGAGADLSEPLDRDRGSVEAPPEMSESGLRAQSGSSSSESSTKSAGWVPISGPVRKDSFSGSSARR